MVLPADETAWLAGGFPLTVEGFGEGADPSQALKPGAAVFADPEYTEGSDSSRRTTGQRKEGYEKDGNRDDELSGFSQQNLQVRLVQAHSAGLDTCQIKAPCNSQSGAAMPRDFILR